METAVSFLTFLIVHILTTCSEEEEPDEFPYPLTLRTKKSGDRPQSPLDSISLNGK